MEEWRIELDFELMGELLDHYGIDRVSPTAWRDLAYCLALVHVPAFGISANRGPGRPRKRPFTLREMLSLPSDQLHASGAKMSLAELARATKARKKPGRPKSIFTVTVPIVAEVLPKTRQFAPYRKWLQTHNRRDSKNAAVTFLLEEYFREKGERASKAKTHVKTMLNALALYEGSRPKSIA